MTRLPLPDTEIKYCWACQAYHGSISAARWRWCEVRVEDLRKICESPFEREVYDELTQRGYRVRPQVNIGPYRIDMLVEGHNDARLGSSATAIGTTAQTSGLMTCSASAI
jgi:hypothetical protein